MTQVSQPSFGFVQQARLRLSNRQTHEGQIAVIPQFLKTLHGTCEIAVASYVCSYQKPAITIGADTKIGPDANTVAHMAGYQFIADDAISSKF